jgi:hypothetical protein
MKPHIYIAHGTWVCLSPGGDYGTGRTPFLAWRDWLRSISLADLFKPGLTD